MNITISDSSGCWLGKRERKKGLLIVICDGKTFSLSNEEKNITEEGKPNFDSLESILSRTISRFIFFFHRPYLSHLV